MTLPVWACSLQSPPQPVYVQMERWAMFPNRRFPGANLWSLNQFWHRGEVRISVRDRLTEQTVHLRPGMVTIYPPGTLRAYANVPLDGTMNCVHFRLTGDGVSEHLPLATDIGKDAKDFDRRLLRTVGVYGHSPAHAVALLWELLWELHERAVPLRAEARSRRVVAGVQEEIERRLHEPLTVAGLAQKAGLSSPHVRRLFHSEIGMSVKRYLQDRRLARAQHLLIQSDRPIKAIAAEVGLPDLQHFNKVIRKALGRPPRAVQRGR